MKTAAASATGTNLPVRTVHDLMDFDIFLGHGTDAVIWSRQLPQLVRETLKCLPTHSVSNGRFQISANEAAGCVRGLFREWGIDASETTDWLAADVGALAGQMAHLLSVSQLLLRVELVRDDACRKFHRDTVKARLICTYSGTGTEFGLAEGDEQPIHIDSAPTGCPILLKGKLWPGYVNRSVVHRSPPIEGANSSRLVVVLNEAQNS